VVLEGGDFRMREALTLARALPCRLLKGTDAGAVRCISVCQALGTVPAGHPPDLRYFSRAPNHG